MEQKNHKSIYCRQLSTEEREKELFEKIHKTIVEQHLFLNPFFSRDTFIRLGLINKNKVARLLKKYTGTNMHGYINGLRLEYAAKLLTEHPDAPMKAVAIDSGFINIRTFYRLFLSKYGATPTNYKKRHGTAHS